MTWKVAMVVSAALLTGCALPVAPTSTEPGVDAADGAAAPPAPNYQTLAKSTTTPTIVNTWEKYDGKSYQDLSADWWNWAWNQPAATHPLLDATGANAAVGQTGGIWYLGGTFNVPGAPPPNPNTGVYEITRNIVIPQGKALFFPILNSEGDNSACGGGSFEYPFEAARADVVNSLDAATGLSATIDGLAIPNLQRDFRVTTGPFAMIYGPDDELNLTSVVCGGPGYRGRYDGAASSGYWLLVRPLAKGNHTIHFAGTLPGFPLDVTYSIVVE